MAVYNPECMVCLCAMPKPLKRAHELHFLWFTLVYWNENRPDSCNSTKHGFDEHIYLLFIMNIPISSICKIFFIISLYNALFQISILDVFAITVIICMVYLQLF